MRRWWPALAMALAVLVMFAPALVGGKVIASDVNARLAVPFVLEDPPVPGAGNALLGDPAFLFHPQALFVRSELHDGNVPLWNPLIGNGRPTFATGQDASLFPANWPVLLVDFERALAWVLVIKLGLAFAGMFLLSRALGTGREAAALAGLAYGLSTYLVTWSEHPHVNVYALVPWMLLGARRAAIDASLGGAALLAVALGLALLGGHPSSVVIASVAVGAAALTWLLSESAAASRRWRALLLAGGGIGGLAIGSVVLLPFLELYSQAPGASRGGQAPFPTAALNALTFPELWGDRPDKFTLSAGPVNFQERTVYFGVLPLILAAACFALRRDRTTFLFGAIALLGLGLSQDWPVIGLLGDLPLLEGANVHRAVVLTVLGGSVLAGLGLQAFLDADERDRRRATLAALVVALIPATWWLRNLGRLDQLPHVLTQLPSARSDIGDAARLEAAAVWRWCFFAGLSVAILAAIWKRPRWGAYALAAAIALTLTDLVGIARGYHPLRPESEVDIRPTPSSQTLAGADAGRIAAVGNSLPPNLGARLGLRDSRVSDPPGLEGRAELESAFSGAPARGYINGSTIDVPAPLTPPKVKLLAIQGVSRVLLEPGAQPPTGTTQISSSKGQVVAQVEDALPRAFVAYGARTADGARQAARLTADRPLAQSRDQPAIDGAPTKAPARSAQPARFLRDEPERIELEIDAARPGHLVLLDTWYPGWKAEIDGRETPIRRANATFRAVAVPAGNHRVSFTYQPNSFRIGLALTLLGLVACAVVGILTAMGRTAVPRS